MCGGNVIPPVVKAKRRNSEKRKEKSRDAARCRRGRESEIFGDLATVLPMSKAFQLDKTSLMRLAVNFLKIRHMVEVFIPEQETNSAVRSYNLESSDVLHGFLLILTDDGNMIFISESVNKHLGIPQAEMIGQSIFEFTHPCDHEEIKAMLTIRKEGKHVLPEPASFFIRMKSTVTSKGRHLNMKSASYRVIHCIGHKVARKFIEDISHHPAFYLISIAEPVPHSSFIDTPLDKQVFISRHSPDMKFTDIDEKIEEFLGYNSSELIGKSLYSFFHVSDTDKLENCFRTLFQKGQCETEYYRFLAKYGGYVWVLTQATVIYDDSTKPECIVCLNYVLSKTENENEVISTEQVQAENVEKIEEKKAEEEVATPQVGRPQVILSCTKSIFILKQEVMNKAYLNFPDTDLLLFQEQIKDAKIPLELELLVDDIGNDLHGDPFISYRDDSLSPGYCGTPESSLPRSSSSKSPDHFSTTPSTPDSGCSSFSDIPNLDPVDEFANLDLKLDMSPSVLDKVCDYEDINFQARAPYISMNMDDDFPLLSPSNTVMWGPQDHVQKKSSEENPVQEIVEPTVAPLKTKTSAETVTKSSLAALLQSDVKKQPINRHEKIVKSTAHRDASHKKWVATFHTNGSVRQNMPVKVSNTSFQKQLPHFRNGTSNGGNGHIIMLDSLPSKKQLAPIKSTANYHKKNGQNLSSTPVNNHSPLPPSLGSHTATVKVNDRLIKVQVSVSELPSIPIEQKSSLSSLPDHPSKRLGPSLPGPADSPKRQKVDNGNVISSVPASNSVLLNLLISGEDASRGYLSSGNSRYSDCQCKAPILSLPVSTNDNSQMDIVQESVLLASESELLDSFLNISQYDADVNAPIQSSHLLQGEDLLDALDLQPSLRDVPTLV